MAPEVRDTLLLLGSVLAVVLIGSAVGCAILFVVITVVDHLLDEIAALLVWVIRTLQVGW